MERTLLSLAPAEAAALQALLGRLIPADEHGPGAVEADVLQFLDRRLAGPLQGVRDELVENLISLDALARAEHGASFAGLPASAQDALLTRLEQGSVVGFTPSGHAFFELVRVQAIQGMFSDPRHGGNAGHAGWDLIGFPGLKGTFSPEDQQLDVDVAPARSDAG